LKADELLDKTTASQFVLLYMMRFAGEYFLRPESSLVNSAVLLTVKHSDNFIEAEEARCEWEH